MANIVWARRNNIPESKVRDIDHYWESDAFSAREKAILKLADWHTFKSYGRIDEETLAELHQHFSDPEIIEMGCYFAIVSGFQKFNSVFQVEYACPLPHPGDGAPGR